jgi:DNA-binding GntR family transcriptional regulator
MWITLDGNGPLFRQLYRALRAGIIDGVVPPGARLPATRALATELGVSRTTVLLAYEQLAAEGYLDGKRGSGSYVQAVAAPGADERDDVVAARQHPRDRRLRDGRAARLRHLRERVHQVEVVLERLAESLAALEVTLGAGDLAAIEAAVPPGAAAGDRYNARQMASLDSERG